MSYKLMDKILNSRNELIEHLISNMEKGYVLTAPTWKGGDIGILPYNPSSKVKYKGINRLRLIEAAENNEYSDNRWMTFNQIQKEKYKLKKGAKGVLCEKWIFNTEKKIINEKGEEEKIVVYLKNPIPNFFIVFNGNDIEGLEPIKQLSQREMDCDYKKIATTLIQSSEANVKIINKNRAYYQSSIDTVFISPPEAFKNDLTFISVLIHEMAHSTGHESRENRTFSLSNDNNYAREELIAEFASFLTKAEMGIEITEENLHDNANYLLSWISMLKEDPKGIIKVLDEADKACERLVNNYNIILEKNKDKNINDDIFIPTDHKSEESNNIINEFQQVSIDKKCDYENILEAAEYQCNLSIAGRLVNYPELVFPPDTSKRVFGTMTLAVQRNNTDKVDYFNVNTSLDNFPACSKKGDGLVVHGRPAIHKYQSLDGKIYYNLSINASEIREQTKDEKYMGGFKNHFKATGILVSDPDWKDNGRYGYGNLAVGRYYSEKDKIEGKKKQYDFYNLVFAENIANSLEMISLKHAKKGDLVKIEGKLLPDKIIDEKTGLPKYNMNVKVVEAEVIKKNKFLSVEKNPIKRDLDI